MPDQLEPVYEDSRHHPSNPRGSGERTNSREEQERRIDATESLLSVRARRAQIFMLTERKKSRDALK